jgi:hypothetical protein
MNEQELFTHMKPFKEINSIKKLHHTVVGSYYYCYYWPWPFLEIHTLMGGVQAHMGSSTGELLCKCWHHDCDVQLCFPEVLMHLNGVMVDLWQELQPKVCGVSSPPPGRVERPTEEELGAFGFRCLGIEEAWVWQSSGTPPGTSPRSQPTGSAAHPAAFDVKVVKAVKWCVDSQ